MYKLAPKIVEISKNGAKNDAISGSVDKWPGGKLTRDSFVYSQVLSKVTWLLELKVTSILDSQLGTFTKFNFEKLQ